MSQSGILELAKQGNPQAIATIINRLVAPYGITARASRQEDCLYVLLESKQAISPSIAVALLQKVMTSLGSADLRLIRIYGRQTGEKTVAWSEEISLKPSLPPPFPAEQCPPDHPTPDTIDQIDPAPPPTTDMASIDDIYSLEEPAISPTTPPLPGEIEDPFDTPSIEDEDGAEDPEESSETINFLARPEAFIVITFAILLLLWDAYIALLEETPPEPTRGKGFGPKPKVEDPT